MHGTVIATCGGYEMVEVGPRIYFIDRGTGGQAVALFVVGVLTLIVVGNGIVQLILGNIVGVVAIAVMLTIAAGVFRYLLRERRARLALRWDQLHPLAFIDRQTGWVHDSTGRAIAPLTHVSFAAEMQMTSSSSALALRAPGAAIVIARGSPFSGSIDGYSDALRMRGFRA